MKIIYAFVLIILIFVIKADYPTTYCEDYAPKKLNTKKYGDNPAFSLDFCRSSFYDNSTYARCCFLSWELGEKRLYNCVPATAQNFSDIEAFEDYLEATLEGEVKSIDCKSSYLYGSIFLILALLF